MKKINHLLFGFLCLLLLFSSCKSLNRTQKGAAIGTAGGGAMGAVIGRASGNTALGAIIGATVGGVTGAVIGRKMDKQAEEIQKEVKGVTVERLGEGIVVEFKNNVLFGFDKSNLSSAAQKNLDDLANILQKYPDTNIEIQGHTDSKGTDAYNMRLSKRRAESVASYLGYKNVTSSRISVRGFGESAPKVPNDTEANRSENRRVDFLITANEKMKQEAIKEAGTSKN